MRKTAHELTAPIKKRLKKIQEIEDWTVTIINVELMVLGCHLIDKKIKMEEAWSLLTGYDEPVVPLGVNKSILSRLRILFSQFTGQSIWEREIEEYFTLPSIYRLIDRTDEGIISFLTPRYDPNRKEDYENILKQPVSRKTTDLDFAKAGKFSYTRRTDNIQQKFQGEIPSQWVLTNSHLPHYREKKSITFELSFDWLQVAKEMDTLLGDGKNEWQNKVAPLQLKSRNEQSTFVYEGVQHIGGGLAAGKSTYKTMNTYWLVKTQKAKVGLLEGNVAQVLERVSELRKLGIKAIPVIGRGNRRFHQENYLLSNPVNTLHEITNYESLSHLSDICTIQALAGDLNSDGSKHYPCKSLKQKNDRSPKKCPLTSHCGVYKEWGQLLDADVWVTTPGAVLHSRLPVSIDPQERLLYEAMYDLLDVIFVDEADQVQKQFDEAFLEEHSAFGNPKHLVEKLYGQLNETLRGNYELADNDLLTQWRKNLDHLHESVWSLYAEIKKSSTLRESLRNKVIFLNYLIFEISQDLSDDEKQQEKMAEEMREFVQNSTYTSVVNLDDRLHGLINLASQRDKKTLINHWISKLGGNIPEKNKAVQLYSKIEFFVYLAHIERAMKWILQFYPVVQHYLNSNVEIPLLTQIKDFRPFMKEAMTGVMLGYRYETKEGIDTGEFKIIQYMAVGRQLLNEWPSLYEAADGKKGPTVILLSGTSYAPESLHYHIEVEPQWFIQSSRNPSKLTQSFIEIRDPENGEKLISVSGVQLQGKRQSNLQAIVKELTLKIQAELNYWKELGEERKVLLVVNSYDDVDVVGAALSQFPQWKGRYRLLSQKDKKDKIWFPRSRVEQFAKEDADILVAPMLAISRGYNIMDKDGRGALFGSAFFLIRPYPVPNDLSYFVQILHGNLPLYFEEIVKNNLTYADAMRKIRKKSRGKFEDMYRKPDYWSILSDQERTVLAWFTFIPTWQLIGRLLRGGKDARVFYCDAKYIEKPNGKHSLLEYWEKIMSESEDDPLFENLYGPFSTSIGTINKVGVF